MREEFVNRVLAHEKTKAALCREYGISRPTGDKWLARHAEASAAAKPYERFQKEFPNEMWQADFKGHFGMGNTERCHPLNIVDDCSRFCLCSEPMKTETFLETKPVITRVFEEFGHTEPALPEK